MYRIMTITCFAMILFLATSIAQAEVVSIEATVKSVDPQNNKITIERKGKTTEFDVSKSTDISKLKAGQKVTLSYHLDLETVLKVESPEAKSDLKSPELIVLQELDADGFEGNPVVTKDGLTIFWNIKGPSDSLKWVWTATRKDQNSLFENKKKLIPAADFTVSPDGLEIIMLQNNGSLASATRDDLESNFSRPKTITELSKKHGFIAAPCLSPDGLTLYYGRIVNGKGIQFHSSTRTSKNAKWSSPRPLLLPPSGYKMRFMTLSSDDKYLFCNAMDAEEGKPNLLIYSRGTPQDRFQYLGVVDSEGLKVNASKGGAFARYLPDSNELFYAGTIDDSGDRKLLLIKNFTPETMVKSDGK
jgi:Cu/Ag efflux protein CusF